MRVLIRLQSEEYFRTKNVQWIGFQVAVRLANKPPRIVGFFSNVLRRL
jgi:hypothetical protein